MQHHQKAHYFGNGNLISIKDFLSGSQDISRAHDRTESSQKGRSTGTGYEVPSATRSLKSTIKSSFPRKFSYPSRKLLCNDASTDDIHFKDPLEAAEMQDRNDIVPTQDNKQVTLQSTIALMEDSVRALSMENTLGKSTSRVSLYFKLVNIP